MQIQKLVLQKGFTLIELMIVVAIIGILATLALPLYQDYSVRARASEGFSVVNTAKHAYAVDYATRGSFLTGPQCAALGGTITDCNTPLGLPAAAAMATDNIASVTAQPNGVINVVYTVLNGDYAIATPPTLPFIAQTYDAAGVALTGNLSWTCISADATKQIKDSGGIATGTVVPKGSLLTKHSPSVCH